MSFLIDPRVHQLRNEHSPQHFGPPAFALDPTSSSFVMAASSMPLSIPFSSNPSGSLPMEFYNVSDDALALFSTTNGSRPKRKLVAPYPVPVVRSNRDQDVEKRCEVLQKEFGNTHEVNAYDWYDLHRYFDAVDLWIEGPAFCLDVIRSLSSTKPIDQAFIDSEIAAYAKQWVEDHRDRLLDAPITMNVLDLFTPDDVSTAELEFLTQPQLELYAKCLNYHRDSLVQSCRIAAAPNGLTSAPSKPVPAVVYRTPRHYQEMIETERNQPGPPTVQKITRPRGWSNGVAENGHIATRRRNTHHGYNQTVVRSAPVVKQAEPMCIPIQQAHASGAPLRDYVPISERPRTMTTVSQGISNDARLPPHTPTSLRTINHQHNHPFSGNSAGRRPSHQHSRIISGSSAGTRNAYNGPGHYDARAQRQSFDSQYHSGPSRQQFPSDRWNDAISYGMEHEDGYEKILHGNGSVTIYYSGHKQKGIHPNQYLRTVFVRNVPPHLFFSHTLRQIMSKCGSVDNISHLLQAQGIGFVTFHQESAASLAIKELDGQEIAPGVIMSVNPAMQRHGRGQHEQRGSHSPTGSYTSRSPHNAQGYYMQTPEHNFNGQRLMYNVDPNMQPVYFHQSLQPQDFSKPLQDIQNLLERNRLQHVGPQHAFEPQPPEAMTGSKENSRLVPLENLASEVSRKPKKVWSNSKNGRNAKKSSQQSSAQPTPSGSPSRNTSETWANLPPSSQTITKNQKRNGRNTNGHTNNSYNLSARASDNVMNAQNQAASAVKSGPSFSTTFSLTDPPAEVNDKVQIIPCPDHGKPLTKQQKKKNQQSAKLSKNGVKDSFSTDASIDTIASSMTESASFVGGRSTNTSFSVASSRPQSLASTRTLETILVDEQNLQPGKHDTDVGVAKVPKVKYYNNKKKKHVHPDNGAEQSVRQKDLDAGHKNKGSISSSASTQTVRKACSVDKTSPVPNLDVHTSSGGASLVVSTTEQPFTSLKINTATVADVKKTKRSTPLVPAPIVTPIEGASTPSIDQVLASPDPSFNGLKSPKQLDDQEWPTLNPPKSPVTAIADGKPPNLMRAPTMGHLAKTSGAKSPELKQGQKSKFSPVAVPRNFKPSGSTS